jgi:trehalose-6-phosphate synthase
VLFFDAAAQLTNSQALCRESQRHSGVAHAIQQALQMRLPERRERHAQMIEVLRQNDITAWHTRFVDKLQAAGRHMQGGAFADSERVTTRPAIVENRAASTR